MKQLLYLFLFLPVWVQGQTISISTPTTIVCTGTPVTFAATTSGVSTPHYKWKINSTNVGTDSSAFTTTTLYSGDAVKCFLTNSAGDTIYAASNYIYMAVDPIPNAGFYLDDLWGSGILCVGQTILVNRGDFYGTIRSTQGHVIDGYSIGGVSIKGISPGLDTLYNIVTNTCGSDTFYFPLEVKGPPQSPSPILTPSSNICVGQSMLLTNASSSLGIPSWSITNNNLALNTATSVISGAAPGLDTVIFSLINHCGQSSTSTVITILPPGKILGTDSLCAGSLTTLTNTYPGGTWSSRNPSVATIDANGLFTTLQNDTVTISYTLGSCTVHRKEYIRPTLPPIAGNPKVCFDAETTLSNNIPGGKWFSSDTSIAIIDSFTGLVHGSGLGNVEITYTTDTGCSSQTNFTVSPFPPGITGNKDICIKHGSYLYNDMPGGKWSCDRPDIATIDPATGFISGVNDGYPTVTYTLPTGCFTTTPVAVAYCYDDQNVFPNPSRYEVTIEVDTIIYNEYAFMNSIGQIISSAPITQTFTTLDIRALPKGVYFIYLYGRPRFYRDHTNYVQTFVKE